MRSKTESFFQPDSVGECHYLIQMSGRQLRERFLDKLNNALINIIKEHIRDAVVEHAIHQLEHPYKDSTDYDVIIDDRPYLPVAIMV